jgi:uncharacterized protein
MSEQTTNADSGTAAAVPEWVEGFREDFQAFFVKEWSPYVGAVLLVIVTLGLMASGLFWGVFGGLRLWADWFNSAIGLGGLLGISDHLPSPLMHRISLLNINLLLGSFVAALIAGQFQLRRPPVLEYVWAALAGIIMGVGATLAGGCTVGGFYTPVLFSSPAGWAMWAGLLAGSFLGLKVLLWTMENIEWGTTPPAMSNKGPALKALHPWIGVVVFALVLYWAAAWFMGEDEKLAQRGVIIVAGFAFGFVLHRARFCFSRAIREPFLTGDGTMTKAMIVALAIGVVLGSVLFQRGIIEDPFIAIPATFWLGSLLGGFLFGFGMIFAGGCASGALWRIGEGQLKLVVVAFFFGWSGSVFRAVFRPFELMTAEMNLDLVEETKVGVQAHLPAMFESWAMAYLITFVILLFWYLMVRYNESTGRFTVL